MPELPEVETIVRELRASHLIGKQIENAYVYWPRIVDTSSPEKFIEQIKGQRIIKIERRAKYIIFFLSKDTLFVHLRMTGKFEFIKKIAAPSKHEHVRLIFHDGTVLSYIDPRKFGRWSLYKNAEEKMASLGIEPISNEFTIEALKTLLYSHSSQIKPFLLNQKYIAGMGNIYVDEALWQAKIHPQRLTNSLTAQEIKKLHEAIQSVLNIGIKNLGTSLGKGKGNYMSVTGQRGGHQDHLNVFRKNGENCKRCGQPIVKMVIAQRGTHFCPACQSLKLR